MPKPTTKRKRTRKPDPAQRTLEKGEHSEFFDTLIRMRDSGDKRWFLMSPGMKTSVEFYERNLHAGEQKAAA
jgi:hypothetical protein